MAYRRKSSLNTLTRPQPTSEPTPPLRVVLPALHAAQRRITSEARRYNVLACGRRFGKSVLGIDRAILPALAGLPVAYYSPTHKMLTEVWREVCRVLEPVIARRSAQEHRLELITGGVVDMWSLDASETSRGRKYKRIVIDEAAMVADLVAVWNTVLRPTLADYEGDAWFLSTPKGLNGFASLYERGSDATQPDWASWRLPTAANPYILPSEIEAARVETPSDLFAQEWLAEFVSGAGAVFRNLDACLVLDPSTPAEHDGHRIVIGIDWAQSIDYTCASVVCADCLCEVEIDRFNQIDYTIQRGRLVALADRWHATDILAEENSIGRPNIEQIYSEGYPIRGFTTTAQSKGPLVQSMALALEREELRWLADQTARHELASYTASVNPHTNRVTYSAPSGQHDDTVIARCLALSAATQRPTAFEWT